MNLVKMVKNVIIKMMKSFLFLLGFVVILIKIEWNGVISLFVLCVLCLFE